MTDLTERTTFCNEREVLRWEYGKVSLAGNSQEGGNLPTPLSKTEQQRRSYYSKQLSWRNRDMDGHQDTYDRTRVPGYGDRFLNASVVIDPNGHWYTLISMPPKEPYDYFKSMLDGTAHKVYIELTSAAESSQYTSNLRKERKGSPRTATIIELLSWENTYLPKPLETRAISNPTGEEKIFIKSFGRTNVEKWDAVYTRCEIYEKDKEHESLVLNHYHRNMDNYSLPKPNTLTSLYNLVVDINDGREKDEGSQEEMRIHCLFGCGRSGLFLTLSSMYNHLKTKTISNAPSKNRIPPPSGLDELPERYRSDLPIRIIDHVRDYRRGPLLDSLKQLEFVLSIEPSVQEYIRSRFTGSDNVPAPSHGPEVAAEE